MSFAGVAPILILWTMMKMHGNDGYGIVSKGRIDSDCFILYLDDDDDARQ